MAKELLENRIMVKTDETVGNVIRYVEAEAGTGWRYAVCATTLPAGAVHREAGQVLVTLLAPWTAAKVMMNEWPIAEHYVREHLCEGRTVSPWEVTVVTRLVALAIGVQVVGGDD